MTKFGHATPARLVSRRLLARINSVTEPGNTASRDGDHPDNGEGCRLTVTGLECRTAGMNVVDFAHKSSRNSEIGVGFSGQSHD